MKNDNKKTALGVGTPQAEYKKNHTYSITGFMRDVKSQAAAVPTEEQEYWIVKTWRECLTKAELARKLSQLIYGEGCSNEAAAKVLWNRGFINRDEYHKLLDLMYEWEKECAEEQEKLNESKLKPCPFCGETDINCNHFKMLTGSWWDVGCPNCGMWASNKSKDEAIAAWNRRVEA